VQGWPAPLAKPPSHTALVTAVEHMIRGASFFETLRRPL